MPEKLLLIDCCEKRNRTDSSRSHPVRILWKRKRKSQNSTVIVVQEDRTARPTGNIGSTIGTSVVAKLGPTPCCSCFVLCVCSTQLPTFVPKNLAKLDIFSSQSMRHFFALELAHVLEGTRIHSFGRAIVMSREWKKEWCMRVLEASHLQAVPTW